MACSCVSQMSTNYIKMECEGMEKNHKSKIVVIKYMLVIFFISRFCKFSFIDGVIQRIYAILSLVISVFIIVKFFKRKKMILKYGDDRMILLIIVYIFCFAFTTIINGASLYTLLSTYYPIIATMCFISMGQEDNPKALMCSYAVFLFISTFFNLIHGFLFLDNSSAYSNSTYLMGVQNQFGMIIAIAFAFVFAYCDLYSTNKMKNFAIKMLMIVIAIANAIMMKSSTVFVCLLVILVMYLVPVVKNLLLKIKAKYIVIAYAAIWFALIVYRLQYLAANFIINILHKNLTLTSRTYVWDEAIRLIKQKLLFGYGKQSTTSVFTIVLPDFLGRDQTFVLSAHNQILQNLYEGGLVLLVLFGLIFILAIDSRNRRSRVSVYFIRSIIVILINWLSESPGDYGLFLLLTMNYYSWNLDIHKQIL